MKVFFIISGVVLWSLIIMFLVYFIYDEIRYRIRMRKLYKKALQDLDEQEKEIMDKLKGNNYGTVHTKRRFSSGDREFGEYLQEMPNS